MIQPQLYILPIGTNQHTRGKARFLKESSVRIDLTNPVILRAVETLSAGYRNN